jgi:hypothetical protein
LGSGQSLCLTPAGAVTRWKFHVQLTSGEATIEASVCPGRGGDWSRLQMWPEVAPPSYSAICQDTTLEFWITAGSAGARVSWTSDRVDEVAAAPQPRTLRHAVRTRVVPPEGIVDTAKDGSCWLYGYLGALGYPIEHLMRFRNGRNLLATAADGEVDFLLRSLLVDPVRERRGDFASRSGGLTKAQSDRMSLIGAAPHYNKARTVIEDMGTFGGDFAFLALTNMFRVNIYVLSADQPGTYTSTEFAGTAKQSQG